MSSSLVTRHAIKVNPTRINPLTCCLICVTTPSLYTNETHIALIHKFVRGATSVFQISHQHPDEIFHVCRENGQP